MYTHCKIPPPLPSLCSILQTWRWAFKDSGDLCSLVKSQREQTEKDAMWCHPGQWLLPVRRGGGARSHRHKLSTAHLHPTALHASSLLTALLRPSASPQRSPNCTKESIQSRWRRSFCVWNGAHTWIILIFLSSHGKVKTAVPWGVGANPTCVDNFPQKN